ncbi:hypothetical protein DPEC_G00145450 [Dallia pectoralis]|uniref:Uncharacterized protein n=1 Tax=Dallia pectoralis TaxID=75939 RepID=A0ACC2GNK8_DALPE|nr:hypothetical protein DPEC_G00145450 [Dallia pectoralis]
MPSSVVDASTGVSKLRGLKWDGRRRENESSTLARPSNWDRVLHPNAGLPKPATCLTISPRAQLQGLILEVCREPVTQPATSGRTGYSPGPDPEMQISLAPGQSDRAHKRPGCPPLRDVQERRRQCNSEGYDTVTYSYLANKPGTSPQRHSKRHGRFIISDQRLRSSYKVICIISEELELYDGS